jgi:hypothetical protein
MKGIKNLEQIIFIKNKPFKKINIRIEYGTYSLRISFKEKIINY